MALCLAALTLEPMGLASPTCWAYCESPLRLGVHEHCTEMPLTMQLSQMGSWEKGPKCSTPFALCPFRSLAIHLPAGVCLLRGPAACLGGAGPTQPSHKGGVVLRLGACHHCNGHQQVGLVPEHSFLHSPSTLPQTTI